VSDSAPAANWQEWCNVGEIGRPCEHGVYSPHPVIEDRPAAYLSPREEQAVLDAVKIMAEAIPPDAEGRDDLCEALPKLADVFEDYRRLKNIAAIAHNSVVWYSGDRKRMFHRLGDLAEELCKREGVEPADPADTQLQMEAVRIRRDWGWHVNE
jgi:hypothetical protein